MMEEVTETSSNDSDMCSIECFQNYTASEVFVQGLAGLIDQQDVESMIRAQKQMLQRFEKTNEMLANCNNLSMCRLKAATQQFKQYKQTILDIKKDLDQTYKRINILKPKLQAKYPESFTAAVSKIQFDEDLEEVEHKQTHLEQETENQPTVEQTIENKQMSDFCDTGDSCVTDHKNETKHENKNDFSDGYSSESGGADSHQDTSNSTSDT